MGEGEGGERRGEREEREGTARDRERQWERVRVGESERGERRDC